MKEITIDNDINTLNAYKSYKLFPSYKRKTNREHSNLCIFFVRI